MTEPSRIAADSLESRRLRARLKGRLFRRAPPPPRLGRYRLGRLVGAGGMGRVYQAHDPVLDRVVAIKVLSTSAGDEATRRLRREGRALAALCHPNIVPIFEIGRSEGRPYVVMELVDGWPLDVWASMAPRTFQARLDAIVGAARGLAAAHAAGVVHCDVKPGNILVGRDGRVRVADFGLAYLPDRHDTATAPLGSSSTSESRPGVGGTLHFMAPERLGGSPADAGSDQFALSITASELLWGTLATPSGRLGGLQGRVASVIRRGHDPDPRRRHASVDALLEALSRARRDRRPRAGLAIGFAVVAAMATNTATNTTTLGGPLPARTAPAPRRATDRAHELDDDPGRADVIARIEAAAGQRVLGRYADAYAHASLAIHDAARRGHPELVPPALVQLGLLAAYERRGSVAVELLSTAYVDATAGHDDVTAARAASAMRLAATLDRDDEVEIWARWAAATATRAGDPTLSPGPSDAAPRRSSVSVDAFGAATDLAPDEAWVFDAPHRGSPACHGHGCAHDLTVRRYDADADAWVTHREGPHQDHLGFGRPVYAVTAGEVIACWRGYPDEPSFDAATERCRCRLATGESRCDDGPPDDDWTPCSKVVPPGGNVLVVLDEHGHGMNYVHLQAWSTPAHLCPNDTARSVPADPTRRYGFVPLEYLTQPDPTIPRPRVEVGDLVGLTGRSGNAEGPQVHLQAIAYGPRDDGNFEQLELLELTWSSGCAAPMHGPYPPRWTPLHDASLNELWREHGPILLRPDCGASLSAARGTSRSTSAPPRRPSR